MSLARGIQSAIFYYLSCKPYFDARHRRKVRKQAARDRAHNELLYQQMPHLYRHPEPNTTNPAWQTEIELGPTPSLTRGKKSRQNNGESRANTSANASQVVSSIWSRADDESTLPSSSRTGLDAGQEETGELLRKPDKAALAPMASPEKRKVGKTFEPSRHPPINDLHPPTVRKVKNREELAWMFEPTPTAWR